MGSGAIKWHVHCSVCGAFIEKSAQSDSEVECKKCRSTLEIFVKDDMVSVRPIHIRDTIIANTKGEGEKSTEDFWVSATRSQTVKSLRTSNGFPLFGELVV